jgi:hypothetical protein
VSLSPKVTIPKNTGPKTKRIEVNTRNPSEIKITTDLSKIITSKGTIRAGKKKTERREN